MKLKLVDALIEPAKADNGDGHRHGHKGHEQDEDGDQLGPNG
jgi:hypothetical protein